MARSGRSLAPLTGVVFVALLVVGFAVGGDTPNAKDPGRDVISFFSSHQGRQATSAILVGLASVFFLFFVGSLRTTLRSGEGATGRLSAVAFAGGVIAAVGMLIFAGLTYTLADTADRLQPDAAQALNALNGDFFFPLAAGIATLLLASGLSSFRTTALPRWLVWFAIVLGVVAFTPIGFFAFLASLAWVLAVSITLTLRMQSPSI